VPDIKMSPEEAAQKLDRLLPRFAEAAQEQDGSRFLQWRLVGDVGTPAERDRIYEAALPKVVELASDVFGNFVVQKIFERGTEEQQQGIVDKIQGGIFKLATDKYGCRVVQKMLEMLSPESQERLVSELEGKVIDCIENMHGNHVVQIMVKVMHPTSVDFIIKDVASNADKMAAHQYGCRVIQRLLERCPTDQLAPLVGRLLSGIDKLATDRHGNYVAQCILEHGNTEDKKRIIDTICKSFVHYAKNKVSSNVVEKCFSVSTIGEDAAELAEERDQLYQIVLKSTGGGDSPLRTLVNDKFGNYTVQSIIKYSRGKDREALKQKIQDMEPDLRTQTGKHIIACMKKVEAEGSGPGQGEES